jgi:hypothetical protein
VLESYPDSHQLVRAYEAKLCVRPSVCPHAVIPKLLNVFRLCLICGAYSKLHREFTLVFYGSIQSLTHMRHKYNFIRFLKRRSSVQNIYARIKYIPDKDL